MIESSDPDERARKRNNRPLSLFFCLSPSLVARFVGNEARWWRQTELKLYNQPTYLPRFIHATLLPRPPSN